MRATIKPNELAALSGYTSQRIRQLQADGVLPTSVSRGKLPRDEAIAALFGHLRSKVSKYGESRASAQNREQQARAELSELDLHERLKTLTPTSRWRFIITDMATTMRVEIEQNFPKDVARKICKILSEVTVSKRAEMFRPSCPRCRLPIFDDELDRVEEIYEKNHDEKTTTKRAKASQPQS